MAVACCGGRRKEEFVHLALSGGCVSKSQLPPKHLSGLECTHTVKRNEFGGAEKRVRLRTRAAFLAKKKGGRGNGLRVVPYLSPVSGSMMGQRHVTKPASQSRWPRVSGSTLQMHPSECFTSMRGGEVSVAGKGGSAPLAREGWGQSRGTGGFKRNAKHRALD